MLWIAPAEWTVEEVTRLALVASQASPEGWDEAVQAVIHKARSLILPTPPTNL